MIEVMHNEEIYISSIRDISSDFFSITIPMFQGQYYIPNQNDVVDISYVGKNKKYSFSTIVVKREKIKGIPLIVLKAPTKVTEIQRREFVRIETSIKVKGWIVDDEKKSLEEYLKVPSILVGNIVDLSGGGLRINISQKLNLNSKVILSFFINDEEINIMGNVVRILNEDMNRHIYGIEYECMKENIRDKIIKYIFEAMRKK
ncbi:putative Flagellar protein [Clostridium bornimense]|uniref:Putative Flagellar protein n=1 Tax=Clostridium bornimense TaxID=1216932 RepID=W6RWN8_9CLOT|nr:putative Flagellar protein [Clostridium bornimense]